MDKNLQVASRDAEAPYRVACACGQILTGTRRDSYQVITCSTCAAERFILPRSPLPPLDAQPAHEPTQGQARLWTYPLLAATLTLLLIAGAFLLYQVYFAGEVEKPANYSSKRDLPARLQAARANLALGKFRLATQELEREDAGNELPLAERRGWTQCFREASLLADLAPEPLEDILRHAMSMPSAEWQADFPHRFLGKTILFDMQLSRAPDGRVQGNYELFAGSDPARLDIGGLSLFQKSDFAEPRRVIFAARLASVALEPPGPVWVVRFLPESGALMTQREAVGRCCPPLAEVEAAKVLERQAVQVHQTP